MLSIEGKDIRIIKTVTDRPDTTQGYTPPGSGLYDVRTSQWDVLKSYRGF